MATTEELNAAMESLSQSIDRSNAEKDRLRERLRLITAAALNHVDGDSQPNDTHWSEIVGIAEGDPNWLQHAKANYEVKHAELVRFATTIVEHVINEFSQYSVADTPRVAAEVADRIEQELLPAMVLAEDGRTFLCPAREK